MIEYEKPSPQNQKQQDMEKRYQNVFSSPEGRIVLGDILQMCHFGWGIVSEEARVEYNVGIVIARMSGMMSEVDALLKIEEG